MVLVKNDQEAVSAYMSQMPSPGAAPETREKKEIGLPNPFTERDDKDEDEESVEMSGLFQDRKHQINLRYTGLSINRPGLNPANCSGLAQQQLIPSCPVCTYPCWNCRTTTESLPQFSTPISEDSSRPMDLPNSTSESTNHPAKKRKQDDPRKYIGPKDKLFATEILESCGLESRIRGRTALVGDVIDNSQNLTSSGVILNIDDQRLSDIADDINAYNFRCYDENSLAFVLVDSLLKRDVFSCPGGPKATRSLRRDKWKIQHAGPQISGNEYYYDWDIEPDATYMISIDMFDHNQRKNIARTSELFAESYGVCPYLTIEYKSIAKGGKPQDALNQVAAASIVWLNHRKNIRRLIESTVFTDLKHYAFTFVSKHVTIWEVSCTENGYLLWELDECSLVTIEGIKSFIEWSNAIHTWGLGPNATAFKEDAEEFLRRKEQQN